MVELNLLEILEVLVVDLDLLYLVDQVIHLPLVPLKVIMVVLDQLVVVPMEVAVVVELQLSEELVIIVVLVLEEMVVLEQVQV